jgi:actin beta/gamma 1
MTSYHAIPIVMDIGTALSKIGFAGEDNPRFIIPTIPTTPLMKKSGLIRPATVSDDIRRKPVVQTKFIHGKSILERGVIKNWVAMENFWRAVFYDKLRVDPTRHPILLADTPLNTADNKNKIAQIMFEKIGVKSLLIILQPSLSLYASNRTTGCIVDIGEGVTKIVPISEGYVFTPAIQLMDVSGVDITRYLLRLLREAGYPLTSTAEKQIAIDIKETLCYVSSDVGGELEIMKTSLDNEKIFKTPEGEDIKLRNELFMAPECLFQPILLGKELPSLSESIIQSISSCDMNLRRKLYNNIILSGGSSKFPGLKERLKKEISKHVPDSIEVNIIAPQEREIATWVGGSIFSSLPSFSNLSLTKEQYEEKGHNYTN